MPKKIYLFIAILFVIIIAVFSSLFFQRRTEKQDMINKGINESPRNGGTDEKIDGIIVKTSKGDVRINDIYSTAKEVISGNAIIENNSAYQIIYSNDRQNFIISILSPDIQKSRDEAEEKFLNDLGIAKLDACLLDVTLSVSKDANPEAAGQNFALSFCPNGKPLPTN